MDQTAAISPLVSTEWLAQRLHGPTLRVADVRWYLPTQGTTGRDEYLRGHIPGAVFLDLDRDLAASPYTGPGRHPIPSAEAFFETMSTAGIGPQTHVVAYDDQGGYTAARLWWLLRYYGHEWVSLLDGGYARWLAEGRPVETALSAVLPARFRAEAAHLDWVVDKPTVDRLRRLPGSLILDARIRERYEGQVEPVDARPGHIPGARNAPWAANLREEAAARLRSPEDLRHYYASLGADQARQIVCYCGSGVSAALDVLALELAGYGVARLYEGSWSDWARDAELPAAVGPEP